MSPFESNFGRRANPPLSNIITTHKYSDLSYEKTLTKFLDEETVTPNEFLPEEQWGAYRSDDEIERNLCKATQDAQTRERNAIDKESRFLRSSKLHRAIPLKESQFKLISPGNATLTKDPKKLGRLYEVLAPGSVVQKTYQYTSVILEP